jgi:hypothetical protein
MMKVKKFINRARFGVFSAFSVAGKMLPILLELMLKNFSNFLDTLKSRFNNLNPETSKTLKLQNPETHILRKPVTLIPGYFKTFIPKP